MILTGVILVALPIMLIGYAYVGYPALLWLLSRFREPSRPPEPTAPWPTVSISLPVYNEAGQIRDVIESLLRLDYPRDRLQLVIVSDASTDGTDEIVREYAKFGVELLRMPERVGKTAAENAAAQHLKGEITVNTDASIRIQPDALKSLIVHFGDATVGVASGRDLSVAASGSKDTNLAEARYVGFEMWVRSLETRFAGIIGASGCFYAIRSHLHRVPLPAHLSRDFASALIAREHGYRAVSVDHAMCLVPRTDSLTREYRRKVRTMSRGMQTLLHKRHLLNPLRHGSFAWMLLSHKVCRWLVPWTMLPGIIGWGMLAIENAGALWLIAAMSLAITAGLTVWRWPAERPMPRVLALGSAAAIAQVAALHSLAHALHGDHNASWEPTRRDAVSSDLTSGLGRREAGKLQGGVVAPPQALD